MALRDVHTEDDALVAPFSGSLLLHANRADEFIVVAEGAENLVAGLADVTNSCRYLAGRWIEAFFKTLHKYQGKLL